MQAFLSHMLMVAGGVAFGEIVPVVGMSRSPMHIAFILSNTILHPMMSHVERLGHGQPIIGNDREPKIENIKINKIKRNKSYEYHNST